MDDKGVAVAGSDLYHWGVSDYRTVDINDEQFDGLTKAMELVTTQSERVLLTSAGGPVLALIPADDLTLFEQLEDLRDRLEGSIALAEAAATGSVSLAEMREELRADRTA